MEEYTIRLSFSLAKITKIEKQAEKLLGQFELPNVSFGFIEIENMSWRRLFDHALDEIHYSGSCQRVGRCMRLAIIENDNWIGGIVLGSTFPNILVRDEALGLRQYIVDWRKRGLKSPWSRENVAYWSNLQKVVNHARTFIFPKYQGVGKGIHAHKLLLKDGINMWKKKYCDDVIGLDTLCTHENSRLFKDNGWTLVGKTKGYTSDPSRVFSKRAFTKDWKAVRNNVALGRIKGSTCWYVWVRPIGS